MTGSLSVASVGLTLGKLGLFLVVTLVAGLLQAFFTERLQHQRNASPNTVAAYRDWETARREAGL